MQFPDISGLPPWAQMTVILAFGVSMAMIVFVTRVGFLQGQKAPHDKSTASAQVAAVIVDPTTLNRATAALEANTAVLATGVAALEAAAKSLSHMAIETDRLREELRIQREISRR